MIEREFSLTKNPVASLVRDLRKAFRNNKYEQDGPIVHVGGDVKMKIGGIFNSRVLRHETVQRAIETGDKLAEAAARALVPHDNDSGCFALYDDAYDHNLLPTAAITYLLNLLLKSSMSRKSTWYFAPFKSNDTPALDWGANWGDNSTNDNTTGVKACELVANAVSAPITAEYNASTRPAASFPGAVGTTITTDPSAPTRFTLVNATPLTLYGATLNSSNQFAEDDVAEILLSATLFGAAKSGLASGDKIDLEYELTCANDT